jgi:hypothetical protein
VAKVRVLLIASAVGLVATALSATAQADPDGDYLNVLGNSPGFFGGVLNDAIYVGAGHRACDALRGGATPEDVASRLVISPFTTPYMAHTIVDAAQATMCPDTKH